ncbi:MAG: TIGR02281 family clan AA aspartic protease [Burkholderiales bacterium]
MIAWDFMRVRVRGLASLLIRISVFGSIALPVSSVTYAASVAVVGLFPTRAVVSINGGPPKTMRVGQTSAEGIKLLEVQSDGASFDIDGKRQTLRIGEYVGAPQSAGDDKVILKAEQGGHFYANATVNGGTVRFLVDTGATMIAISTIDARRLGISYLSAPTGRVQTANGPRSAWKIKLDTVSIGAITMNNIDATVLDGGLNTPLLGMSFLSRTSIQHEGDTLTMVKRF